MTEQCLSNQRWKLTNNETFCILSDFERDRKRLPHRLFVGFFVRLTPPLGRSLVALQQSIVIFYQRVRLLIIIVLF